MEVVDREQLNVSGCGPHLRELRNDGGRDDGCGTQRDNPHPTRHDRK
jgi:hypothetical protein